MSGEFPMPSIHPDDAQLLISSDEYVFLSDNALTVSIADRICTLLEENGGGCWGVFQKKCTGEKLVILFLKNAENKLELRTSGTITDIGIIPWNSDSLSKQ